MKFKWLIPVFLLLLTAFSALAVDPYCTEANTQTGTDYLNLTNNTVSSITMTADTKLASLDEVWFRLNYSLNVNQTVTSKDVGTTYLTYFRATDFQILNTTGAVLGAGNYSLNTTTSVLTWALDADAVTAGWNNTAVVLQYNTLFVKNVDNLVTYTHPDGTPYLTSTAGASWGDTTTFRVLDPRLNGQGYAVLWTYTERTCETRDACKNTQNVIYAAFGIMALFCIVGAAFMLVNMARGGADTGAAMALMLALIGLAVALIVGIVVIANVGATVCLV